MKFTSLTREEWERLSTFRGMAAVLVAFGHMVQIFVSPTSILLAPYSGLLAQASVMMFFVISGASIAASANHSIESINPVYRYMSSRASRILPPLFFSLVLMWLLSTITPYVFASGSQLFLPQAGMARDGYSFEWANAFGVLIFQNGFMTDTPSSNGPLWSLSFEVWLYVIYFLCFLGFKRGRPILWLTAIGTYGFLLWSEQTKGDYLFLKYSLVWSAGVLLFHLLSRDERSLSKKSNLRIAASISAAALTIYFGWGFISSKMTDDITSFNLAFGLFFFLYLWITPPKVPNVIRAIVKPAACFGYTLYLVHFPIYLFVFGIFQPHMRYSQIMSWVIGLTTLLFTLFFAFFSAKVLERRELFVGRVG